MMENRVKFYYITIKRGNYMSFKKYNRNKNMVSILVIFVTCLVMTIEGVLLSYVDPRYIIGTGILVYITVGTGIIAFIINMWLLSSMENKFKDNNTNELMKIIRNEYDICQNKFR